MSPLTEFANGTHISSTSVNVTGFGPQRDSLLIVLPITIIYSLIFITGLLGNIFTCLVIVRNKSMHTATNYYLFNLAISDLLLLISGMPQEIYSIWSKWPYVFGHSFCVIRGLAAEASTNASVLTITLFTVERYKAICYPFVSHQMSKLPRATKHILLLWVVAFGWAIPQALQFGIRLFNGTMMCLQTRTIIEHSFELSTFFFFFAPMVVITVLYSLIGLKLRESSTSEEQTRKDISNRSIRSTREMDKRHSQSTRRVVKMLVAVVVAFFICWAPFHAQRLVAIYGSTENHLPKSPIIMSVYSFLTYISGVFYYMSTCINPIFYHIMSNKFRSAFKNTMKVCCRSNNKAVAKRCSYTAIAFAKNPTSSGTNNSGNSLRNDTSLRYQTRRQDSRERNIPIMHVCHNGKTIVTTPVQDHRDCNKHSIHQALNEDIRQAKYPYVEKRKLYSQVNCANEPSPTETVAITLEAISLKDNKDYLDDEPENYLREIKLRILQREKEYG